MIPVVADPLLLLAAGLALDAWVGDLPAVFARIPHPVVLAGRAVAFFDRRLNREIRSEASRRVRGIVTVVVLVGAAAASGLVVELLCRGSLAGAAVEILLIAILVAQRSLFEHVAEVARALADSGPGAGRDAVRHIVGRDPASLDAHGVARAAIESLAENFSDGVVAPVFWYLVLGLPGLFAYKMANTLDSMIGHRTPHYRAFGWAAARLDDLANLVPARASGLLIAAAAVFARDGRPARALAIML
ncbi:MAG: adenosylcobinamide-phosphate synthase CbiB, partial [Stellaceae bacterium]